MTKITAEEALEEIRSINDFEDVYIKDLITFKTTDEFDKKVERIQKFVHQQLPPTFYELQNLWSLYSEDVEVICEDILLVYDSLNECELFCFSLETGECSVAVDLNSLEMIGLISKTLLFIEDRIRYLESQKEKENDGR